MSVMYAKNGLFVFCIVSRARRDSIVNITQHPFYRKGVDASVHFYNLARMIATMYFIVYAMYHWRKCG